MRDLRFGKIERQSSDPDFGSLRQVVLPIFVLQPDGQLQCVGSCFIVCCTGREAIALTAKHNVDELIRLDGGRSFHAASTLPEFRVITNRNREPKNTRAYVVYPISPDIMVPCNLVKAWSFSGQWPDIAVALLRIPGEYNASFTHRLPILSHGPKPEETVQVYGYSEMIAADQVFDDNGVVEQQTLALPLKQLTSAVLQTHPPEDHFFVKSPCFVIDKSPDHGMSGGPVMVERDGAAVVCGMVTSGSSFSDEGVASVLFPGLLISVDTGSNFLGSNHLSLLDCVRHKMILDLSEAHKHLLPDGTWSEHGLVEITIETASEIAKSKGLALRPGKLKEPGMLYRWISEECVYLGKLSEDPEDTTDFILISRAFRETVRQIEDEGHTPNIRFVKAEVPYLWFAVNEINFRFFVLVLDLPDELGVIKILTDAVREG